MWLPELRIKITEMQELLQLWNYSYWKVSSSLFSILSLYLNMWTLSSFCKVLLAYFHILLPDQKCKCNLLLHFLSSETAWYRSYFNSNTCMRSMWLMGRLVLLFTTGVVCAHDNNYAGLIFFLLLSPLLPRLYYWSQIQDQAHRKYPWFSLVSGKKKYC